MCVGWEPAGGTWRGLRPLHLAAGLELLGSVWAHLGRPGCFSSATWPGAGGGEEAAVRPLSGLTSGHSWDCGQTCFFPFLCVSWHSGCVGTEGAGARRSGPAGKGLRSSLPPAWTVGACSQKWPRRPRRCVSAVCTRGEGALGGCGERLTRKECGFLPARGLLGTISSTGNFFPCSFPGAHPSRAFSHLSGQFSSCSDVCFPLIDGGT